MGHPGIFRELSLDLQYPLEIIAAYWDFLVAPETLILELILERVVKFSRSYTSAVKVFIPSFKGAL